LRSVKDAVGTNDKLAKHGISVVQQKCVAAHVVVVG